ncbi:MAG: cell division protein FtsA [Candidatus Marinimicrobia bacterium]|nr:cell division protein FtsA [Candidatus Neomarinimicrobiota bacterium]
MKNLSMTTDKNIITGIDIGSATITCSIVDLGDANNDARLLGIGTSPSTGIRKGCIIHRDKVSSELESAITNAETMANVKIQNAWCSLTGDHIRGINTNGATPIHKAPGSGIPQEQEIRKEDVQKAFEMTKNITFPPDRNILHVLPQEFIIDTMTGIKDPVGMTGRRLEARVHLVTTAISAMTNLVNCVEELGITVHGLVFQGLASAIAVLDQDEMELGVACVDIGAETTEVTVFFDSGVRHTGVIPIGANSVTNDIAVMLQVPKKIAEEIKLKYASAKASMASPELDFEIPDNEKNMKRNVSEHELSRYVEARMVEILQLAAREVAKADIHEKLTYGLVLTGGGSELKNLAGLAEEVLKTRVRIGSPRGLRGISDVAAKPQYACALGLTQWYQFNPESSHIQEGVLHPGYLFKKLGKWFKEFF